MHPASGRTDQEATRATRLGENRDGARPQRSQLARPTEEGSPNEDGSSQDGHYQAFIR